MYLCIYYKIDSVDVSSQSFHNLKLKENSSPIVLIEILTIVLKEERSERGYNPETPSNFQYHSKVVPLDDMPT